ncbi:MAG: carboxyvinyl-carboxyphosphonate phosphorylmutase [Pseudomonadales bacterium]|nr:carboxyvinyl-carboxyphosphonate phosphorylmutase [Pseudomonadales bacterium]
MLKDLLLSGDTVVAPGAYDALSALIASQSGFKAIYLSGFGVAGSLLGKPDIGLVTAPEMIERVKQVVEAAGSTPVIADGDNGYGDEQQVALLVNAYEKAGAQCIQLEDQVSPKRCGHMDNKEVVDLDEAAAKIAMAVRSRNSENFMIMARTDSRATHDLNEALRRGKAFLNAGADILFIEAPTSIEELQTIKQEFPETVLVANMVEEGKTPELNVSNLADLGYQLILHPITALLAAAKTLQNSYASIKSQDNEKLATAERLTFQEYNQLVGLDKYK